MLEIRHLSAGYFGKTVLSDVNLAIPRNSLTVIVGPNGCGKSTLVRAVSGSLPHSGEILFQGQALHSLSDRERAKLVSCLPQNRPVPEIAAERLVLHGRFPHLSYPRHYRKEDHDAAQAAMDQLGIRPLAQRYVPSLSGGERQKVYIAMLLAQGTPIVLMDEPTAYLDIAHKFEVLQIARKLTSQGKTVVLVLHDLDLALTWADRIAVMESGCILQCASPEEVFESGVLERTFRIHMGRMVTKDGIQYYFLPKK